MGAADQSPNWTKLRLLLVDPDDQFRFWVRSVFRRKSIEDLHSAPTAEDAKPWAVRLGLDAALVTLGAAVPDNLEFLYWLRNRRLSPHTTLPVIVLGRDLDAATLDAACLAGIEGLIPHPVTEDELLARTAAVLLSPRRMPVPERRGGVGATAGAVVLGAAAPNPARGGAPNPLLYLNIGGNRAASSVGAGTYEPAGVRSDAPSSKNGGGFEAPPPSGPGRPIGLAELRQPERASAIPPPPAPPEARKKKLAQDLFDDTDLPAARAPGAAAASPLDLKAVVDGHAVWLGSRGAEGARAQLDGADLIEADLRDVVLSNAAMRKADLSDGDCTGAVLDGCDLRDAMLSGNTLRGATLAVARLRHANLKLCDLQEADLRGADLSGATLRGANLRGALMKGAILLDTDLSAADLTGVEGLTQAQIDKARGDPKTKLPFGLRFRSAEDIEEAKRRQLAAVSGPGTPAGPSDGE